jgi:hypothetical protein
VSLQSKSIRATEKGTAMAEAFIALAVEETVKRTRAKEPTCTAEQIVEQRDTLRLGWRQVAANLELGSPGAARRAYTKLTGRPHNESAPVQRRSARSTTSAAGTRLRTSAPQWDDDSDQDEIMEAITHRDITVARVAKGIAFPDETVHVSRIIRFAFDGPEQDGDLVVHVYTKHLCQCRLADKRDADTGVARTFRVADIKEVIGWKRNSSPETIPA